MIKIEVIIVKTSFKIIINTKILKFMKIQTIHNKIKIINKFNLLFNKQNLQIIKTKITLSNNNTLVIKIIKMNTLIIIL